MGEPKQNFLMRAGVLEAIFCSFALITVPLVILFFVLPPPAIRFDHIGIVYFACFGASHFFVTFAIYCNSENLRYFVSDSKNVILYLGLPLVIMGAAFYFYQFSPWKAWFAALPLLLPIVELTVRGVDFLHVQRQSYGVLQLLKGSTGRKFANVSRSLEKWFFPLMALAAWTTLVRSYSSATDPVWGGFRQTKFFEIVNNNFFHATVLAAAGCIFAVALVRLVTAAKGEGSIKQRFAPLCYFVLQSAAVVLAVLDPRLYAVGAAMHYTEYHLLVYQRSVAADGSAFRSTPRPIGQRVAIVCGFYAVVLGISLLFAWYPKAAGPAALKEEPLRRTLNSLFLAVILFHFYIDTLIWRFRKPFYKKSLGPVYFGDR